MQVGATRVVLVIGHEPPEDRATIGGQPKVVFREARDKLSVAGRAAPGRDALSRELARLFNFSAG